ncbi:MAG: hypothetical protein NTZ84_02770, partial [Candidatus Nealsonbacteria bacterium]|nr:hypothetical protein [Candidatus Nealsonbacteria bacterium]
MATHAERLDNLEEKIEQLKEKEEDPEQFVSALLKDVFSKLGENHAGDLVGYISQQIDNYILENYISKTDLENYLSKEDIGDVVKEICDLLQTEVGVNTTFL